MHTRLTHYITTISVAALLAAAALVIASPPATGKQLAVTVFLCVLSVVATLLNYELPHGRVDGTMASVPFIATALVAPHWIAAVGITAVMLVQQLIRHAAPHKIVFNVAQSVLAMSLAILAYGAMGGESLFEQRNASLFDTTVTSLTPVMGLMLVFGAVNSLAVSGVIAVTREEPLVRIWRANTLGMAIYDVLISPFVFLLAWVCVSMGMLVATLIAAPVLGAHHLYKINRSLTKVSRELLDLMVKAVEARDPYTSGHSVRVSQFAMTIARAIGLNEREVQRIGVAGLLHDVGKIYEKYAPILRNPGKLSKDEWITMKEHPVDGAHLVATISQLRDVVPAVRHHHESWDGSGYPDGLKGEAIPIWARILTFADTIDAMTSDRPYRRALTEGEVRAEIIKFRGKQFDPAIADKLLASPLWPTIFRPVEVNPAHRYGVALVKESRSAAQAAEPVHS